VLIVVALGGHALQQSDAVPSAAALHERAADAARALAPSLAGHQVLITHGNGPQVGHLLGLHDQVEPGAFTLASSDAESDGLIGHALAVAFGNARTEREVATVLTHVVVRSDDPAFARPTKPIGPTRLVASPRPVAVLELGAIDRLVRAGVVVIAAGGGGIPVVADTAAAHHAVDAVVDKDHTSALLAIALRADRLVSLTDVDAVYERWGSAPAQPIGSASTQRLRSLSLDAGSMGPKVDALCDFVDATGATAAIGSLDDAAGVIAGTHGTQISARSLAD
jgi:carbamate kinase